MVATTTAEAIVRKVEIYCRTCNHEIRFDKNHRTPSGKWIPLNMDMSHHNCPAKKREQQQQTHHPHHHQESSSIAEKEISQLRAEMRVFFEHLNSRLDYIQKLLQQERQQQEGR